jgi:formylmethanofuran dehydrogenase subunit A
MGQVIFTDTTTMTADGPFQFILYQLSGNKWINGDVEAETSSGIVPFNYKRSSYVHSTQWSIALELALLVDDPWKIYLSTDHPNAGPFTAYPRIIAWLMSQKAREKTMNKINRKTQSKSLLSSMDREYSPYEIAIATRAGQAKALGLKSKGHLGIGADADIAVYNLNPEKTDLSKNPRMIRRAFRRAAYTIKDGQVVVKNGEIVKVITGRTIWVNVETGRPMKETISALRENFGTYYTVQYENYQVPEHHIAVPAPMRVRADV